MIARAAGLLALMLAGVVPGQTAYVPSADALPPPGPSVCPDGLCQTEALERLFDDLAATEAGTRQRPVHILQIGDSHTAGDQISGALRARMQLRFGQGGRGVLPPGVPYDGYSPFQIQVQEEAWIAEVAPRATPYPTLAGPPMGAPGLRALLAPGQARFRIVADRGAEIGRLGMCGARGAVMVEVQGETRAADLATPDGTPACRTMIFDPAVSEVAIRPGEARAELYDLRLETGQPGVIVSNLGVVGATLRDLAGRDDRVLETELADWRPSLIVLGFGANEGFEDDLNAGAYEALLRGQIERMRRMAPAASLMLLGTPDALKSGAVNGCSTDPSRSPPPSLAVVRDVQRRVAAEMGVAFWDWQGRMGGACAADRLARRQEPLMRGDRVHFTSIGGDWIGGILNDDLMSAYERWKAARSRAGGR